MLSAHYRSPLNFSAELMEAAKNSFERITNAVDHLKHLIDTTKTETMTEAEIEQEKKSEEFVADFEKAIDRALAMGMSREDILETVTLLLEEK